MVGSDPIATDPDTSNLFNGLVVPIPVFAVVPSIVPLSKISELPTVLTPVNLDKKFGVPDIFAVVVQVGQVSVKSEDKAPPPDKGAVVFTFLDVRTTAVPP